MLRFMPEIQVMHIVRLWALLHNILENYKKVCNDSLLLPSLQIKWFTQAMPRCSAAAWQGFNSRKRAEFPHMIPLLSKWTRAAF